MISLKIFSLFIFFLNQFNPAHTDLSIFPDNFNKEFEGFKEDQINQNRLSLFPNVNECPETKECIECDTSNIDKDIFCQDFCSQQANLLVQKISKVEMSQKENETKVKESNSNSKTLNIEGFLLYYRKFVHTFVDQLKNEEIDSESLGFNLNIQMTKRQNKRLKQFAETTEDNEASKLIPEVTDILNNMFRAVEYRKQERLIETLSKSVFTTITDPRVQMAFFSSIILIIMFTILFRQIRLFKFSIPTFLLILLVSSFIVSIVNNHFKLIQKKQIFKQQALKERVPDECFHSENFESHVNKNENSGKWFFSETFSHIKSYFKTKPTSQRCLEYHEAMLIDASQINLLETIIFTLTESSRPLFMLFGESINLFYSSLTKDLSFYQSIPLMFVVTSVLIPLLIFMMSLLSLLLFGYEFNFFHLISFKKSYKPATEELNALPISPQTLTETLRLINQANQQSAQMLTMLNSASPVETLTSAIQQPTPIPIEYNTNSDDDENNESVDLNESISVGVKSLIENGKKRETDLLQLIEELKNKNKELSDMVSPRISTTEVIKESSNILDSTSEDINLEKKIEDSMRNNQNCSSRVISIGMSNTNRHSALAYEKTMLNNNFVDDDADDEDIVVIMDEK